MTDLLTLYRKKAQTTVFTTLFVLNTTVAYFFSKEEKGARALINLDCLNEGKLKRIVCFDNQPQFTTLQTIQLGSTLKLGDYYTPNDYKIVVQEHTSVEVDSDAKPLPPISPAVMKSLGLVFMQLYVAKLNHNDGKSLFEGCPKCKRSACQECGCEPAILTKSLSVTLTDKKALNITVPVKLDHLAVFCGYEDPYGLLELAITANSFGPVGDLLMKNELFSVLLWTEQFVKQGKEIEITSISSVTKTQEGTKRSKHS